MQGRGRAVALGIAALGALLAPLPFGGTRPAATLACGLALALALVLLWIDREALPRPPARFAWLTAATALWIGLQFVPLPAAALGALSPRLAAEARASLALEGEPESLARAERALAGLAGGQRVEAAWRPLAVDRDGAVDGALRLAIALAAFFVGLLAVRDARDRRLLVGAIAVSAFFQATYGLAEALSGHHHIFHWAKVHYRPLASGTFICPNHFAALLSLGLFALLGLLGELWLGREGRQGGERRAKTSLAATAAAVVLVGMIWSSSRAALGAAAAGCVVFLALALPGGLSRGRRLWPALAAAGVLIALLVAGAIWIRPPEPLANDVENITVDLGGRQSIWRSAADIGGEFWLTGSGLGSFRHVHPLFRPPEANTRFIHAHNDYLEWVVETGLPGALLLLAWLAALGVGAAECLRRERQRALGAALVAGLAALALQEGVDFSLQLPGVALPAFLLGGALFAPTPWGPGPVSRAGARVWPTACLGLALALLLVSAVTLVGLRPAPASAGRPPGALVATEGMRLWARRQVNAVLRAARAGSPLELADARGLAGSAWLTLQRAAVAAPLRGELRVDLWLAAQSLLALDPSSAPAEPALAELLPRYLHRAEELAPSDRQQHLALARTWQLAGQPAQARRVVRRLLTMAPSKAEQAYGILGGDALTLPELMQATPNRPGAARQLARFLVTRRRDHQAARIVLSRALARAPEDLPLRVALAGEFSAGGRFEEGLSLLDERPGPVAGDPLRLPWLHTRARLLAGLGRPEEIESALDALRAEGVAASFLDYYRGLAALAAGDASSGVESLERAVAPEGAPLPPAQRLMALVRLGQEWQRQGSMRRALDAFRRARDLDPAHPAVTGFFERLGGR